MARVQQNGADGEEGLPPSVCSAESGGLGRERGAPHPHAVPGCGTGPLAPESHYISIVVRDSAPSMRG